MITENTIHFRGETGGLILALLLQNNDRLECVGQVKCIKIPKVLKES